MELFTMLMSKYEIGTYLIPGYLNICLDTRNPWNNLAAFEMAKRLIEHIWEGGRNRMMIPAPTAARLLHFAREIGEVEMASKALHILQGHRVDTDNRFSWRSGRGLSLRQ